MSYQNPVSPRFYIDYLTYWKHNGLLEQYNHTGSIADNHPEWLGLNPSSQFSFGSSSSGNNRNWLRFEGFGDNSLTIPSDKMWSAVLGHNLHSKNKGFSSIETTINEAGEGENVQSANVVEIVNDGGSAHCSAGDVDLDGFTMRTFTPGATNIHGVHFRIQGAAGEGGTLKIGSCAYGNYYDMPKNPNIRLTMTHDYSGISKSTSVNGDSMSNANWIKPPKWGELEAWQLTRRIAEFGLEYVADVWVMGGRIPRNYSGKRVWNMTFSYMSEEDFEPRNYTGTKVNAGHTSYEQGDVNWFENVLRYTIGGHLPFIFQPNRDANYNVALSSTGDVVGGTYYGLGDVITEVPELAICRFDMDTFSREQTAPNVYDMSITVRECW